MSSEAARDLSEVALTGLRIACPECNRRLSASRVLIMDGFLVCVKCRAAFVHFIKGLTPPLRRDPIVPPEGCDATVSVKRARETGYREGPNHETTAHISWWVTRESPAWFVVIALVCIASAVFFLRDPSIVTGLLATPFVLGAAFFMFVTWSMTMDFSRLEVRDGWIRFHDATKLVRKRRVLKIADVAHLTVKMRKLDPEKRLVFHVVMTNQTGRRSILAGFADESDLVMAMWLCQTLREVLGLNGSPRPSARAARENA